MPVLSDIRSAVSAAIASVTTSVSAPVADVPVAISPNEEFTFNVTAANVSADGTRLINVRYHVFASPGSRAQVKVPNSPPARANSDSSTPTLTPGTFALEYFLFPTDNTLDVGDLDTISNLKGKALALGTASICCHIHADVDVDFLFPKNNTNPHGCRNISIV